MGSIPHAVEKVLTMFREDFTKQVILYGPPGSSKTYCANTISATFLYPLNTKDGILLPIDALKLPPDKEKEQRFLTQDVHECIPCEEERRHSLTSQYPSQDVTETYLESGGYSLKITTNMSGRFRLIQFHPSYSYEDFVRGIQVTMVNDTPTYEVQNKIFGELADKAQKEVELARSQGRTPLNYVLVIDEINRAPLSSVLGELIYGLEYRGEAFDTPYPLNSDDLSTNQMVVPENLYIIGTMNTADRSIGSMDYAVRRRFAFVPLWADSSIIRESWKEFGESHPDFVEKVLKLFDTVCDIVGDYSVDSSVPPEDIQIGHSYFLYHGNHCENRELATKYMKYVIEYKIQPVLLEYVRDDVLKPQANPKIQGLSQFFA